MFARNFLKFQHGIEASLGSLKISKKLKKKTCCSVSLQQREMLNSSQGQVFLKDKSAVVYCLKIFFFQEGKTVCLKSEFSLRSNGWTKHWYESWKCSASTV